jgi:16S rRNA (guanine527-N7)-methyltransferase
VRLGAHPRRVRPIVAKGVPDVTMPSALVAVLEESQSQGFLGSGPVEAHLDHARGFAASPSVGAPRRFLDLGSGGGVPGLVLATLEWPSTDVVLLDAGERRCVFLAWAVEELGLAARVTVRRGRAEEAGRDVALRGGFDLVVARSFASPAVTAECAAPFLQVGGRLVVSEPPEDDEPDSVERPRRWPEEGLAELGLRPLARWASPFAYQAFEQVAPCADRYPRRTGVPSKRPLF